MKYLKYFESNTPEDIDNAILEVEEVLQDIIDKRDYKLEKGSNNISIHSPGYFFILNTKKYHNIISYLSDEYTQSDIFMMCNHKLLNMDTAEFEERITNMGYQITGENYKTGYIAKINL